MGWWAACQGVKTGGLWSQMERKLHINCLKLLAGSFAVKSFTKDRVCVHVTLLGGDPLSGSFQLSSSSLGMGPKSQNDSQCRTFFRFPECRSGLRVSPLHGRQQLSIMPECFSFTHANPRALCEGSVCGLIEHSVTSIFQLEPDPLAIASDAL